MKYLLMDIDCEDAGQYCNKNVVAKYNGKRYKVYFKVICDDLNISESITAFRNNNNILFLEYKGLDDNPLYKNITAESDIYMVKVFEYGNNITEEDIEREINGLPSGVTAVFKLPSEFSNIRFIYDMSRKYPRARFIGGNLFKASSLNVGILDRNYLDKHDIKYEIDSYLTTDYNDLLECIDYDSSILKVTSKAKRTSSNTKKSESRVKKSAPKIELFADLFSGTGF